MSLCRFTRSGKAPAAGGPARPGAAVAADPDGVADHNAWALAGWLVRNQQRPLSWILAQLQEWAGDKLVVVDSLTDLGLPARPDSRALVIADRGGLHLP